MILHGTDTLAYTSSVLSVLLENLSKPVVVTGSQKPISEPRSDAVQNLVSSLEIAAARSIGGVVIPEVMVFFRDKLLRGCRTTKLSANSYTGFDSPNYKALATAGEHIVVDKSLVLEPTSQRLYARRIQKVRVASLDIFPGLEPDLLDSVLKLPDLRGVVLSTFGAGNAPSNFAFLDVIESATERGLIVVNVTQCVQGEVELGLYEVNTGLLSRGVISGIDLTKEAALAKLLVVLGEDPDEDPAVLADRFQLNLRGEQRLSIFHLHFPASGFDDDSLLVEEQGGGEPALELVPSRPMVGGREYFDPCKVESAYLWFTDLEIVGVDRGIISFLVFLDLPSNSPLSKESKYFVCEVQKMWRRNQQGGSAVIEVTHQIRHFVDAKIENRLTVVNRSGLPLRWKRLHIACFCDIRAS